MIAADTNVLARLLVSDDLKQQKAVADRLEVVRDEGGAVLVSSVVLAELSWVLTAVYEYDRAAVITAVQAVLSTPPFSIPDRGAVVQALEWYAEGPADFADYLILALGAGQGASSLLTFDKKLLKHPLCASP